MAKLLHIRVGKCLKNKMQDLIDKGLFSNQAEIVREGLRNILFKYEEELRKGNKLKKK
jgi:Arc/MetJ-type ribon-helix-helix transcriptional regulator|tara:strand:+ start:666 stop:839 length:174 start_codon:yes stop_codon:yes gene_type:complete